MVSMPVVNHEALVVKVFRLPVMDSQPQFWAQQEVQTEPPSPPTQQVVHQANAKAENLRKLIEANYMCPICLDVLAAPVTYCAEGHAPLRGDHLFIYVRVIQDAVVSLMDGIAREFVDVSAEDGESQEDELRSYASGPMRDNWELRSRVGLQMIDDLRRYRTVGSQDVARVVAWARSQLSASSPPPAVSTSAQPASTAGTSAELPIMLD
ncbi:hypothetical protein DEU56DRAFT_917263 [Suillus clintonianus]|uniref:uncharacterized protein n=1 Tax=Suillus clintonianus TaxID=1904413 RepID=UPI001B8770D9|nr:uncharacterized protein DEU56DRAFT_917263 [Suillus clintonianus]KAG2123856.1 hypothetical protein DEU56DRAFT_917263 [Suillus clintonianus]